MKLNLLAFSFCAIPMIAFADLLAKQERDDRKYHGQIMEAERLISDQKFSVALSTYDNIFQAYDFVFFRDYKIATQIALYLNNKEKALDFIKEGIAAGLELKTLKKNRFLA